MLISAGLLPHPPLLVPEVASGAASELDGLRAACVDVLKRLQRSSPERLVVVGSGAELREFPQRVRGTLRGHGVDIEVSWPTDRDVDSVPPGAELPLSLTIAAYFLRAVDWRGRVQFVSVPGSLDRGGSVTLGESAADGVSRLALLVMGDGSSTLTERSPGYHVAGAEDWQKGVTAALSSANLQQILSLTADDAERYGASGIRPWWVLAGAARDCHWRTSVLANEAPYGVDYLAALWMGEGT